MNRYHENHFLNTLVICMLLTACRTADRDETYDPELAAKRHANIVNELWPALEKRRMEFLSKEFNPENDWWGSKATND